MSYYQDKEGRWHVHAVQNNQRVHRRLPQGAGERDAKLLEAQLLAELKAGAQARIGGDPPLVDVMALYIEHAKTLRSPKTAVEHALRIGRWVEQYRASQTRECYAHILRDLKPHYRPATINRSVGTLKKALRIAYEMPEHHPARTREDWSVHVKRLPENNERYMTMTLEQVKTIADCASKQARAAIWIAVLLGLRRGETVKLRREDIGVDRITLQAGNTKTLKTRVVPVIKAVRPWLRYVPLEINHEGFKSAWRRAREKAGMPQYTIHDLRRSFGSLLVELGVDIYTISKLLGHSSVRVTEKRYAHMMIEQQLTAMKKLDRLASKSNLHRNLHRPRRRSA